MKGDTEIPISTELVKRIEKEVEKSGGVFVSVSDYVEFVFRELLMDEQDEVLSQAEEKMIRNRLRALGYIE